MSAQEAIQYLGIILIFGVLLGHLMGKLNIPSIAGYVLAGLILGPSLLELVDTDVATIFNPIADIALAFLAFSVGTELFIPKIKESGIGLIVIALAEVLITWAVVTFGLWLLLDVNIYISLLLGSLAASTSPAPILMIKKQFNTKSKIVDESIAICALDDALGIIVFGVAKSIVDSGYNSTESLSVGELLQPVIIEMSVSVFFGIVIGIGLGFLINTFAKNKDERDLSFYLETTFISVVLSLAFAYMFDGSTILLPLVAGIAFTNIVDKQVFDLETRVVDLFALPFLIVFFTLAGIQIDIKAITAVWMISLAYILLRAIGKYSGGFFGSLITKHQSKYTKQVGILLLPLGGVEIGLALSAQDVLSVEEGNMVKLVVLGSTLVFSIFGTFAVSRSLFSSGEINQNK